MEEIIDLRSEISQTITDGVTNKAPSENVVFDRVKNFRTQNAGGIVTAGINVIIGDLNNAVASDIGNGTIGGGGLVNRENIIGGSVANVNTGLPNTVETGTNANYSVITGGYDNVASGLMSVISGAHNYTKKESTHGTIGGGSVQSIDDGDYNTIGGGHINKIQAGDSCTISGGTENTINIASDEDAGVIGGGYLNSVTARYGTVGGGNTNNVTGVGATISGGYNGTASGNQSSIAGGQLNTTGGVGSFAGAGYQNTLSATSARSDYSATVGGYQNNIGVTSASRFSGVLAGRDNNINAEYASILGGRYNSVTAQSASAIGWGAVSNVQGQSSLAGGFFSAAGDAQCSNVVMRRQSTDATPIELRAGDTLGSRLSLVNDSTYTFSVLVVARQTNSDAGNASYKIEGCIAVQAGGTTQLKGTPTVTVLYEDNASWDVAALADNTNKALQILVTGEAAKTINWVANVTLVKVTA